MIQPFFNINKPLVKHRNHDPQERNIKNWLYITTYENNYRTSSGTQVAATFSRTLKIPQGMKNP